MMFNVALIIGFAIIVLAALLISLAAILWFIRRQASQQRPAGRNGSKEKTGDELDESQAAEITATWNILNPP